MVFAIVFVVFIIYETVGRPQYECEVCVEFEGSTKCLTVRGDDEQVAMQTGKENACSFITNGRAEGFRCSGTPPASVQCRRM